jgi:type I restriction enzyme S subunit
MVGKWKKALLGDLTMWSSGGTPTKANPDFWNGDIPWISASSMKTSRLCDSELKITKAGLDNGSRLAEANSILLLVRGSELHKRVPVGIATRPVAFNQDVKALRARSDILSEYLFYWLSGNESMLLGKVESTGIGAGKLDTNILKNLSVQLPPLADQKAIAAVLGALDDKIELNRRMNATLEAMARALFQSWFVDFDPVRAKLDGRKPEGMDAATAALFPDAFQESEAGHIPKGWEVKTAEEISTVGIGKTPPRMEHQWFSENPADVPWMSIRDLGSAGVFISHTSEFLTTEAVEKFRVKRIPDNTVVLSFKLTMGRVAITDGEMLSNEAIAHFRLNPETTFGSAYLYCYLKGFGYDQLGSTSSIATAINSDMVRGLRVLVPPKEIAEVFERSINPMFTEIKTIQKQSHSLATLRDTLLPKLLNGEIKL